jgi:hypothetical protein
LGVLRVLLNQSLELNMTGQELLSWSQHSLPDLLVVYYCTVKK